MKGLKKTSPLETHIGISIYWQTKIIPNFIQTLFRYTIIFAHFKTLLISKKEKDRRKKLRRIRNRRKGKKEYYKKTAEDIAAIIPMKILYLPVLYNILNLRLVSFRVPMRQILEKKNAFIRPVIPISSIFPNTDLMKKIPQRTLPLLKRSKFKMAIGNEIWIGNIFPKLRNQYPIWRNFTGTDRIYFQWQNQKAYTYDHRAMYLDLKKIINIPWLHIKLGRAKYATLMMTVLHTGMLVNNFSPYMLICKKAMESTKKKHYEVLTAIHYILALFFQLRRNLLGYQMFVSGTVGRHGRSKMETVRDGKLSLGTLREKFGYSSIQCLTKFGNIGIKFWCELLVIEPFKRKKKKRDGSYETIITTNIIDDEENDT